MTKITVCLVILSPDRIKTTSPCTPSRLEWTGAEYLASKDERISAHRISACRAIAFQPDEGPGCPVYLHPGQCCVAIGYIGNLPDGDIPYLPRRQEQRIQLHCIGAVKTPHPFQAFRIRVIPKQ